jgi:hypothetical protein
MAHLLGEEDGRGILAGRVGLKGAVVAGQSIRWLGTDVSL